MLHRNRAILALAILPVLAIGLAACGSSNSSDSTTNANAAAGGAGGSGNTVATKSISGTGTVLVDSMGAALYTNDMDTGSKIVCTDQCLTEWVPLSAPSSGGPTSGDSAVQSKLGTVKRPDGSSQVTWGGMPLYTFVEDSPGKVTGNGFSDEFGGNHFVWTAATSGGSTGSGAGTTTQQSSGGSNGIGY
jgi:predicted lipoprotein with Yx(FWY)xxD motif